MQILDPFIFGALIFGGGATMMAFHWDKIFRLKFKDQTDEEQQFFRTQYKRRMITSGMITLVGILFVIYRFLPEKSLSKVWVIAIVLLLVGAIMILALVDFAAMRKLLQIQGVKTAAATRDLADELQRLRKLAKEKKKSGQTDDDRNTDHQESDSTGPTESQSNESESDRPHKDQ